MLLPRWIPFLVAAWVIAFGILRIRIATRKDEPEDSRRPNFRKKGYYARSKKSHFIYGVAYLILGAMCIAMGFGWHIKLFPKRFGAVEESRETQEAPSNAVPVEMIKEQVKEERGE